MKFDQRLHHKGRSQQGSRWVSAAFGCSSVYFNTLSTKTGKPRLRVGKWHAEANFGKLKHSCPDPQARTVSTTLCCPSVDMRMYEAASLCPPEHKKTDPLQRRKLIGRKGNRKCLETKPIKSKPRVTVKGFELARMRGNDERAKEMGLWERKHREHTQGLWVASVAGLCQEEWVSPSLPEAKPGASSVRRLLRTGPTTY